jgi:hypothetical protein
MKLDISTPAGAVKSQAVRLVDVFLLGPAMIYIGTQQKNPTFRWFLIATGAATIGYNWRNYRTICEKVRVRASDMATDPKNFASYTGCGFLT